MHGIVLKGTVPSSCHECTAQHQLLVASYLGHRLLRAFQVADEGRVRQWHGEGGLGGAAGGCDQSADVRGEGIDVVAELGLLHVAAIADVEAEDVWDLLVGLLQHPRGGHPAQHRRDDARTQKPLDVKTFSMDAIFCRAVQSRYINL